MEIFGDYHMHTYASDGHASLIDQARAAIKVGLSEIAITDHSFHTLFSSMSHHKFANQKDAISMINTVEDMPIKIYHGVEGNLVNLNGEIDIPEDIMPQLDLLSLGFHRFLEPNEWDHNMKYLLINGFCPRSIREKLRTRNTWSYLTAMEKYPIDVLVHLQNRALVDTKAICEKAAEKDIYIELNEKHVKEIEPCIQDILDSNVKLILGSDAHYSRKVGKFDKVKELIAKYNIPLDRIAGIGFKPTFKDKSGYTLEK